MKSLSILFILLSFNSKAQFSTPAGEIGSIAISKNSSLIQNWANQIISFKRGPENILNPNGILASYGDSTAALGPAEGNSYDVVSLGDGGSITLAFENPITNVDGYDFAVFENSISNDFLELAFVEVSSDSINYVRFPATSLTQNSTQVVSFGNLQCSSINNLAGTFIQGFGTPFNLEDLIDSTNINIDSIKYIRVIDVIGSIHSSVAKHDHLGNIINDPFPTEFESSGFDLDGIGIINQNNYLTNQIVDQLDFVIYPNPVKNEFTVSHSFSEGEYFIYALSGRLMQKGFIYNSKLIDISYFSKGSYFLEVKNETTSTTKIIIKE